MRDVRDRRKQWLPKVGRVVVALALHNLTDALETHARINVLVSQGRERTVGIAVVLDEYEVPDLHDAGIRPVHLVAAGLVGCPIDVNLSARPARTRLTHFPEIVFAEEVNVVIR